MNGYYNITANRANAGKKIAFEHQSQAFNVMNKVFTMPISGYKGTMVVLPTGGGKTFTAVRWLCDHVLSKNIKILWLAQSTYLLDQAFKSFSEEINGVIDRDLVNVRVVSGSENHATVGTVALSDDVIICTTQTAILNYKSTALDINGNEQKRSVLPPSLALILFFMRGQGCEVRSPAYADDNRPPVKPILPYNEADENGEQDFLSCSPFSVA